MSIAKYPTYKATGLEWLEVIPSHWEVKRLKQLCNVFPSNVDKKTVEGETPVRLCNYTDVYYNDFVAENLEFMAATATEEQIAKFSLKAGDTIITKDSETADDIAIAAYVPHDLPGVICGYHLSMVRPKKAVNGAFVKRLFDSTYTKSLMAVRSNGLTRVGLSQYAIDNIELPLPPKEEQTSIAAFLDRETAKIDDLIAEQQRLIELLQEKRQAVISHAVTKGLNPDAPMKDSGVEWLGEVPEHWEVVQVRRITESHKQGFYSNEGYVEQGVNLLRITDIQDDASIDTSESPKVDENSVPNEFLLEKGDFVFARTGGAGSYGFVDQLSSPTAFASYLIRFRFAASIEPGFLRLYFLSKLFLEGIASSIHGGVNQNVHAEDIKNQWLALAPKEEQQTIASKVFGVLDSYAALSSSIENEIRLLNERRSALISAAVTGKIDVRGLVGAEGSEQ